MSDDAPRFSPLAWHRGVLSPACTLDPQETCVNLHLVKCCDANGQCFPGMGPIAAGTRVGRTKVIDSIQELEARGLVTRERQTRGAGHGSNRYTLPAEPSPSALGGLPRTQRRQRNGAPPSPPGGPGGAPGGLPLVRQADLGSAPGAPYLDQDLILTAQGSGQLPSVAAPATPLPALELTVLDPTAKTRTREKKAKRPTKKRAARSWTKVPADWEPTAEHADLARELGVSLEAELKKFRRWIFDRPKKDAHKTFTQWLERAPEFAGRRRNNHAPQQTDQASVDWVIKRSQEGRV